MPEPDRYDQILADIRRVEMRIDADNVSVASALYRLAAWVKDLEDEMEMNTILGFTEAVIDEE